MTSPPKRGFLALAVQLDPPKWNATNAQQLLDELQRAWRPLSRRVGVVAPFNIRLAEHQHSPTSYWIISHFVRNASTPEVAHAAVIAILAPAIERVNPGAESGTFVARIE
jgi:hypothetical protein